MKTLPWFEKQLPAISDIPPQVGGANVAMPKRAEVYAHKTTYVTDRAGAEAMVELAYGRSIGWIGIDTEFRYSRPLIVIDDRRDANDPSAVEPMLVSLSLAEPAKDGRVSLATFVVDVREGAHTELLRKMFRLPVPFVGHFLQAELYCLWHLGITEPRYVWDSWVAERGSELGLFNLHYKLPRYADDLLEARLYAEQAEFESRRYSLVATCHRHGVSYDFSGDKELMRKSFLVHELHAPFSESQINYAAEDAKAAAKLYPAQVHDAMQAGLLNHFQGIEMPWVVVNARIIKNGVRIDPVARRQVRELCSSRLEQLERKITEYGIASSRSYPQLLTLFEKEGLLGAFRKAGRITFEKDQLKTVRDRHPVIELLYEARTMQALQRDKILLTDSVGLDGRIHPDHRQLGADSGRQSCRWPNLLGLDRTLRPLVIPEPGCGIGEVDLSQVEVGVAAAFYGDSKLVEMFNTGDVYSAMAQFFFADQLTLEERNLPGHLFKKQRPEFRNCMKTCTLGIIYGLTPHGLAIYLKSSESEARALQDRFGTMFPVLQLELVEASQFGALRGYSFTSTGLRRHRGRIGPATSWERNWLRNHPVQGSACAAFKLAGIRLDKLYQMYGAKLILPVHDAFVFEARLEVLSSVAQLTERTMCEAVQEHFPILRPRAEINISAPECWNKDGRARALDEWLSGSSAAVGTTGVESNRPSVCPP